jgi:hypothetical protein
MKTLRLTALLPVALFVGCGGSSDFTEGDDGGDGVPLAELPAEFAAAQCTLFERCLEPIFHVFFSLEECGAFYTRAAEDSGLGDLEAAVEAGTVKYDGKKAAQCLDTLANRDCEDVNQRTIDVCEDALAGTVEAGGDCELDEECTGSLICEISDQCPGTCVDRYVAGDPCTENDECADGLICSNATMRCIAPASDGEACGGGVEPECEGGSLCTGEDNDNAEPGTCAPLDEIVENGVGEPCTPTVGGLCEEGLSCVVDSLTPTFTCKPMPASGGDCGIGFPENCPNGEYCAISAAELALGVFEGNCQPLPQVGEACAARPIPSQPACEAYARCDEPTGMCLGIRGLGESCSSNALCYSGNCENGGCAPVRACQ